MAFIAELSLLAEEVMSRESNMIALASAAIDWLTLLSFCAMRFHIWYTGQTSGSIGA